MLTNEQLQLRRQGIGSSDIAAIFEADPFKAPLDVYLDKIGLAEPFSSTATWCGDHAEPMIAAMYAERQGIELFAGPGTMAHRAHPWALATPDRTRAGALVEIKNVGARMLYLWAEGVPEHVLLQVQWQLEVCDVDRADVAALLGGTDFQVYPVERDRALGAELLEVAGRFWREHVLARVPPLHTAEQARRLARLRHPMNLGHVLPATDEAVLLRDQLAAVHAWQKELDASRAALEARAMELTGGADGIEGCWSWKRPRSTWKGAVRKRALEAFGEQWDRSAKGIDDEIQWQAFGQAAGVTIEEATERRFLLKKTTEERHGERRSRAGVEALQGPARGAGAKDLRGAEEAPRGALPDEW